MSTKPSPPKLNRDGLKEFRSRTNGREILVQLTSRLEELDMEHRDAVSYTHLTLPTN